VNKNGLTIIIADILFDNVYVYKYKEHSNYIVCKVARIYTVESDN